MTIEVTLLGTGSPLPSPDRAGPSTLVRAGSNLFLFDAGRAVGLRLAASGVVAPMLSAVFLTHLHSDHITDLNDVVTSRWVMSPGPAPLPIVGPVGTAVVVDAILAMLGPDIGYRLAHHDDLTDGPQPVVTEVAGGVVFDEDGVRVIAAPTDHRPVEPTLGFRIEHEGTAVVIGGDGVPCAGLDELCAGADAYVQTVLREDLVRAVPFQRFLDTIDYHSTVQQAAQTAARAGVGTLVMTHPVPAPQPGTEGEWVALAAEHFGGTVVLGEDLTTVTV
ncbi:ribonuclease Z [Aquihabitans sp. G128]|uniref:ribonuclease Z n=1 Tax=Aquihabitans sp. G128 TaxID=2849779 RepID=UPI001C218375|nr:ribonuclease Z [Aquihabitans sp. G128]QXC61157.1 ribonuclease Z [Aquihabitans sp. G128]